MKMLELNIKFSNLQGKSSQNPWGFRYKACHASCNFEAFWTMPLSMGWQNKVSLLARRRIRLFLYKHDSFKLQQIVFVLPKRRKKAPHRRTSYIKLESKLSSSFLIYQLTMRYSLEHATSASFSFCEATCQSPTLGHLFHPSRRGCGLLLVTAVTHV